VVVIKRALLAAAFALSPLAAGADDAAPPVQDWSKNIETVVVTADRQGPLIWHINKGKSDLYIVGVVGPVPKGLQWNTTGVQAALKDAKQLLMPPGATVGLFEGLWFLMWNRDAIYLPDETPMESTLSEPLRQRFVAARTRLHKDADRYSSLRVPLAGLRLEGDFLDATNLTPKEPAGTIEHLASRAGVPTKRVAQYEAIPLLKQIPKMSTAANEVCMKAALDDVEAQGAHARDAADAWATGDLDGVRANFAEVRFESCVQALPSIAALFQRAVNDSAKAADGALSRPGKTVMVASMGTLLRQNGLLDHLKGEGLTIDAASGAGGS
jgi:uncharacterized protein YbaP (TraB family)